jgi:hypothetical protein
VKLDAIVRAKPATERNGAIEAKAARAPSVAAAAPATDYVM